MVFFVGLWSHLFEAWDWDFLRTDLRFQDLLRSMRFPQ